MTRGTANNTDARRSVYARIAAAVGRAWTEARLTDRSLMALRTELSRHAGAGS